MTNDRKQRAERAEQMRKEREKADKRQRNVITIGIVVVVVALIAAGGWAIKTTSDANEQNDELVAPAGATDDYGIVYAPEDAGAEVPEGTEPVSVELYEDFQCPSCRMFEEASGALLKSAVQSGDISITFRPFSFLDGASLNEYSSRATNAALCALDSGGVQDYVKVHDHLYANQPDEGTAGPEDAELIETLESLGVTGVESCVRTKKFGPWIEEARAAGQDDGVSATPTVKVDGKVLESPSPQAIQEAIVAAQES